MDNKAFNHGLFRYKHY